MKAENPEDSSYVDTLVIGGGVNGTSVAAELAENGHEDFMVADPEGYGSNLLEYAESIGMESMRSPMEHSLGEEWDLWEYASERGRLDEIEEGRPSVDLFGSYWEDLVDDYGLEKKLNREKVEEVERNGNGTYSAVIGDQEVEAENVVLATGKGPLNYPDYAEDLPDEADAYHAFDEDFDVYDAADYDGETYVIGGGITAGQVASSMADAGADVTMVSRSEIETAGEEADEEWQEWSGIRNRLDGLDDEERYETVRDARYDGAMPEYVYEKVAESDAEVMEEVDILSAEYTDGIEVELSTGESGEDVQLIYATGFQDAYEDPFYQDLASELGLDTGFNDMPALDDGSLEWMDEDGYGSGIYVTGDLAAGSLGPFAGNIRGSQLASDVVVDDILGEQISPEISQAYDPAKSEPAV
jgi:cation diffusion facilitator CzcD-associated flavoprotein CzcO